MCRSRPVAYNVIEQILHAKAHRIGNKKLHALLRCARALHGHPRSEPQKKNNREEKNNQFHREEIRYRVLRIGRMNVQQRKKRQRRLGKQPVHQSCYRQNVLFAHESPAIGVSRIL